MYCHTDRFVLRMIENPCCQETTPVKDYRLFLVSAAISVDFSLKYGFASRQDIGLAESVDQLAVIDRRQPQPHVCISHLAHMKIDLTSNLCVIHRRVPALELAGPGRNHDLASSTV